MNPYVAFEAEAFRLHVVLFRLHVVLKGASFALQEWGDFGPCSVTCGKGSRGFGASEAFGGQGRRVFEFEGGVGCPK